MRIIRFAFLLLSVLLSGCCIDCKNTREEYDYALQRVSELETAQINNAAWINYKENYYSKIETQRREAEAAVLQTRVCDYIIPLCPGDMTAPGRIIIKKYGTDFDTPEIHEWQLRKLFTIVLSLVIILTITYFCWISIIKPNNDSFQEAKLAIERSYERAARIESTAVENSSDRKAKLEEIILKLENREKEISTSVYYKENQLLEKETELNRLEKKILTLEKDIFRLKATMDAMKGF